MAWNMGLMFDGAVSKYRLVLTGPNSISNNNRRISIGHKPDASTETRLMGFIALQREGLTEHCNHPFSICH